MPVVFEVLELLSLKSSKMLRMIELEVEVAAMLQLANSLPMAEEHHTFEKFESLVSIGGELAEPHA